MRRGWKDAALAGAVLALALSGPAALAKKAQAPEWLRQAAAAQAPAYDKDVGALVLLDERQDTVDEDGRLHSVWRYALRLLTRDGRPAAAMQVTYLPDTDKLELRGWLIRPTGEVEEYDKDQVADVGLGAFDLYVEGRAKRVSAADVADAGAVFGLEATIDSRSVFTQLDWQFQAELPVLLSRYTLRLPEGWRTEGITFNHAPLQPLGTGSATTWELRELAPIPREPASPPVTSLAPRLAVSWFPPAGRKLAARSFASWAEVSRWLGELSDPQAEPDASITAKAKSLVAEAQTELERIEAVARFVQSVRYVSIQTGIGRGGGYRPHAARDVLAKGYGDCKDKANLMRSLLKAVGIAAYPVSIFSGDSAFVRREWPSPQQFNHCILAVRVGPATEAQTVLEHPALGRLLLFDPTDEHTRLGDLPEPQQGSLALVVAGEAGDLVQMPSLGPEASRMERRIEAILAPDGSISASLRERSSGQAAAEEKRLCRSLPPSDYARHVEAWLSREVGGAKMSRIESGSQETDGRFELAVAFSAPRYAQQIQGRLLVFKPMPVPARDLPPLVAEQRTHPVVVSPQALSESAHVRLPAGFEIDELPEPAKLEESFGNFVAGCEARAAELLCTRELVLRRATVPAERYEAVRQFFEQVRAAQEAPVVLARSR